MLPERHISQLVIRVNLDSGMHPNIGYKMSIASAHKTVIQDTWIASSRRSLVAQRVREECVHDAQRVCSAELQHTFFHGIAGPKAVKTEFRIRLFSRLCVCQHDN